MKNMFKDLDTISIHALCEEGDMLQGSPAAQLSDFYPRPLRGGRRGDLLPVGRVRVISIHALCEEGDR